MLTKAELLVAADCAERYPSGRGYLLFSCDDPDDDEANAGYCDRLAYDPGLVAYG